MSEERIEGYKFFVNKIWNATRFALMNLEDYPDVEPQVPRTDKSLPDRWIESRLRSTIRDVVSGFDEYRFNEATGSLYHFIWHEFCDWYLELIKPVLYGKEPSATRLAAQNTLYGVLKTTMKLLHPTMPFVTEDIWQTIVNDGTSIMVSPFPTEEEYPDDPQAEAEMGMIMEVITKIRAIRGEMGISPAKKLRAILSAPAEVKDSPTFASLEAGAGYVINLANLEELRIGVAMEEPKGAATGVVGNLQVFVLLEGAIDVTAEKARLEKEMAKLDKELAIVARKLANRDFLAKAAAAVVQKEEEKYKEIRDKHILIEKALKKVQELAS
jgi:valyl-tRNA synthetase